LEQWNVANPDVVFTAIHPDFYSDETPYLLTGVEFPGQVIGSVSGER